MTNVAPATIHSGFSDPVSACNITFRKLLSATSYPGRIFTFEQSLATPPPLNVATMALCLSLVDFETPLWLDETSNLDEVRSNLRFHCSVPLVDDKDSARFAIIADALTMPIFTEFSVGETDYPDRSATLIIQVPSLTNGPVSTWGGPGIKTVSQPKIAGLPDWFWSQWDIDGEIYPLGVDVFFTTGNEVISMPRTIQVEG